MKTITQEQLKSVLHYEPETGEFRVINDWNRVEGLGGNPCRDWHPSGYYTICLFGNEFKAHRLAWLYMTGEMPKIYIDHINGNRKDNRFKNLRECDHPLNAQNQRKSHRDNKSGYLGVTFVKETGRFKAGITTHKKYKHLGCFATAEEAHAAYMKAKKELHEFYVE
jgi:hypothetical protein